MAPVKIEVSGSSKIFSPAELAILTLDVRHNGPEKEKVTASVLNASAQLREMLVNLISRDDSGEATPDSVVTEWSTSGLSTGSYLAYGGGGNEGRHTYNATVVYLVSFQDFSKLGDFAARVLSTEYVEIRTIDWKLSQKTIDTLGTRSRHEAVQNAVRKAQDYASAISVTGMQVTHIKDVPDQRIVPTPFSMTRGGGPGSAGSTLVFEPEKVSLSCEVLVTLEKQ